MSEQPEIIILPATIDAISGPVPVRIHIDEVELEVDDGEEGEAEVKDLQT